MTATTLSSTEILVEWTEVPFGLRNGEITYYEILYDPHKEFGGLISYSNVTTPNRSIVLVDLQEYVTYSISVRANNGRGAGPYSDIITVITAEDGKYMYV